jgi:aminoglycoside 6'-N-acetyltransferase
MKERTVSALGFRRLRIEDIPLIHHWLSTDPVVNHFWCYDKQESFEDVVKEYSAYVTGEEPTDAYLVLYDETPIGYVQTYLWRDYPGYEAYAELTNAASIDVFIGEESYRYRGLGPELLTRFLREVVFADPGVATCVIGPEVSNTSAIRAYAKVGFRYVRTVYDLPDEPAPVYLMTIGREQIVGVGAQELSTA